MYLFISILIMLAALALVFIVLVQNSKGGGLASGFASTNNIMGVRKTTDVLEKSTWWLSGIVMVLCIVSTIFIKNPSAQNATTDTDIINAEQQNRAKQPTMPAFGNQELPVAPQQPATTEYNN